VAIGAGPAGRCAVHDKSAIIEHRVVQPAHRPGKIRPIPLRRCAHTPLPYTPPLERRAESLPCLFVGGRVRVRRAAASDLDRMPADITKAGARARRDSSSIDQSTWRSLSQLARTLPPPEEPLRSRWFKVIKKMTSKATDGEGDQRPRVLASSPPCRTLISSERPRCRTLRAWLDNLPGLIEHTRIFLNG